MNKLNILNDLLSSIKNGYSNKNKYAYCNVSKFCIKILFLLYKERLIISFKFNFLLNKICIQLKYHAGNPLILNCNLISKGSIKYYSSFKNVQLLFKKYDLLILSTSNGLISSKYLENNLKIGGQILFGIKIY